MAERLRLGGRQAPSGGRKGKRTSCAFFASPPTAAASTSSAAAPLRLRLSPLGQQGGRPVIFTNGREWLAEDPGLLPGRTMCVMAPESHTHSHAPPPFTPTSAPHRTCSAPAERNTLWHCIMAAHYRSAAPGGQAWHAGNGGKASLARSGPGPVRSSRAGQMASPPPPPPWHPTAGPPRSEGMRGGGDSQTDMVSASPDVRGSLSPGGHLGVTCPRGTWP